MNIKKAAASFLFMIFAMVCNVSMAFASWGGGWGGFTSCVLCGASTLPTQVYSSSGVQKYTEFYGCDEIEGLESSTTHKYRLKNLYCVKNADGIICPNCLERIISDHKGNTGGDDDSVYTITVPESVTLANTNGGTGDYTNTVSIKATGELLSTQKVYFNTSAPTMHRDGSTDVVCTANATTATEWDATAVKGKTAQTNYSVTAHLTPGDWTGNMVFYASIGNTYEVEEGDNSVLLSPAYEDKTHIVFESDNPTVASVNADGYVVAFSTGTANITKTVYDSTGKNVVYSVKYTINVKASQALMEVSRLASVLSTLSSQGKTITVISFGNYTVPSNVTTYDVSGQGDKSIVAYVPSTMSGWGIQGSSELRVTDVNRDVVAFAAGNSICFKSGASDTSTAFDNIKTVNYDAVDTTRVTSAAYAFSGMKSLTSITGLSRWDTGSITTMNSMFNDCSGLTSIDLSSFNTKKVTDMSNMFSGCSGLTSLDVSTLNTANVTNMTSMFKSCSGLTSLDVSGFSTDRVTSMENMFRSCTGLTKLDLTNFNTGNVLNFNGMMNSCSALTEIDVGSTFGTANLPTAGSSTGLVYVTNKTRLYVLGDSSDAMKAYDYNTDNRVMATEIPQMVTSNLVPVITSLKDAGTNITTISFGDYSIPSGTTTYDVSGKNNGAILAYVSGNELRVTNFDGGTLIFGGDDSLSFQGNTAFADIQTVNYGDVNTSNVTSLVSNFAQMTNLTNISGLDKWDTSNVTTFRNAFRGCAALTKLDLSTWDTGNVTDMGCVFYGDTLLKDLNITNWSMSNVTAIDCMFINCSALPSVDVSNWNTGNIANMNQVFSGCTALTSIDVSNWNVSKVTTMRYTFSNCSSLTQLSLQNWNTVAVADMRYLFNNCKALSSLDLSSFDTGNVTSMKYMFSGCSGLTSIQGLGNWNTSKVTDISYIFNNCSSLTALVGIENWDTSNVTTLNHTFYSCSSLTQLPNLAGWDTSKVTNMYYLFRSCGNLTSLVGIENWDVGNVTDMTYAFAYCRSLSQLPNLASWNTNKVQTLCGLFSGDTALTEIKGIDKWNISSVTDLSYVFNSCSNLKTLPNLSKWNTEKVQKMAALFSSCSSLTGVQGIEAWNTSNVTSIQYMFANCGDFDLPDLGSWDTSKVTNMQGVFEQSQFSSFPGVDNWNTQSVTNMSYMFDVQTKGEISFPDFSNWDTSKVQTMAYLFSGFYVKEVKGIEKWNTSSVTNMDGLFFGLNQAVIPDLNGWDTSNVTSMRRTFRACYKLTNLSIVKDWDVSHVTDMREMFANCSGLTDASAIQNWDISNVTKRADMFSGAPCGDVFATSSDEETDDTGSVTSVDIEVPSGNISTSEDALSFADEIEQEELEGDEVMEPDENLEFSDDVQTESYAAEEDQEPEESGDIIDYSELVNSPSDSDTLQPAA